MLRSGACTPDAAGRQSQSQSPVASTSRTDAQTDKQRDLQELYSTLNEYLQLEHKFQPNLCLPTDNEQGEVTVGARDGAAHVMRCLKVCLDLPAPVLFHAINLFDRFLTKMKVRPCHVPCITVSCLNIAIEERARESKTERKVAVEELVSISQSTCTTRDVTRMSLVIVDKLSLVQGSIAVTCLQWLNIFNELLKAAETEHCQDEELVNLLEIAACDSTCANLRASELALVLLYHKLEANLIERSRIASESGKPLTEDDYRIYEVFAHLQTVCHMNDASLILARRCLLDVLARYENRGSQPYRQRLVWRLSERTLKLLRPTDRLTSLLPTIEEQNLQSETDDWPRSPMLPVYCDN